MAMCRWRLSCRPSRQRRRRRLRSPLDCQHATIMHHPTVASANCSCYSFAAEHLCWCACLVTGYNLAQVAGCCPAVTCTDCLTVGLYGSAGMNCAGGNLIGNGIGGSGGAVGAGGDSISGQSLQSLLLILFCICGSYRPAKFSLIP